MCGTRSSKFVFGVLLSECIPHALTLKKKKNQYGYEIKVFLYLILIKKYFTTILFSLLISSHYFRATFIIKKLE